jgi:uncharacterized RDD family membrane protein YckC
MKNKIRRICARILPNRIVFACTLGFVWLLLNIAVISEGNGLVITQKANFHLVSSVVLALSVAFLLRNYPQKAQ